MNINRVTISGADNEVSKDDMLYTQEVFPFVEWGILISMKRMGSARYPTLEWVKNLHSNLNISMHLCGDICRNFVNGGGHFFKIANENRISYNRIQLNHLFSTESDYMDLLTNIGATAWKLSQDKKAIILPYNKSSKANLDSFIAASPTAQQYLQYLYDSSGGRGTEIKTFHKPLQSYTGYAGGIGVHNVREVCEALSKMNWIDNVWIDLESGARTDGKFDIGKVNNILAICSEYVGKGVIAQ